jgi:hypothetical protein
VHSIVIFNYLHIVNMDIPSKINTTCGVSDDGSVGSATGSPSQASTVHGLKRKPSSSPEETDADKSSSEFSTKKAKSSHNCPHGKKKNNCKECGGSGVCEHGNYRYYCKACGGSGICKHGCIRYNCVPCCGSGICEHRKQRHRCIPCGGSGICGHSMRKENCKTCSPHLFCQHAKKKKTCTQCKEGIGINLLLQSVKNVNTPAATASANTNHRAVPANAPGASMASAANHSGSAAMPSANTSFHTTALSFPPMQSIATTNNQCPPLASRNTVMFRHTPIMPLSRRTDTAE